VPLSFYMLFLSCVRRKLFSLVRGPIDIVPFSVCTEYEVQGSVNHFQDMKFSVICHRLDEEIVDMWECRKKYVQLFYITFLSVMWYLKFHNNCPYLWKFSAFNNDPTSNFRNTWRRNREREWEWERSLDKGSC